MDPANLHQVIPESNDLSKSETISHQTRLNGTKATVVVFDGEIGAGKTTLIEKLAISLAKEGFQVAVVPEPVDK